MTESQELSAMRKGNKTERKKDATAQTDGEDDKVNVPWLERSDKTRMRR
jgi:hypothetical protein